VINLTCVWGLSQERGKEAICEEARKVTALAKLKRTSWRGIVDVVHGGEKTKLEQPVQKTRAAQQSVAQKSKEPAQTDNVADNLKRKASISSEPVVEDPDKPLSKREIKRRAKKAKFDAKAENAT
jgi:ribonuclease P/MRP protein subunit RPP1